MENPSIGLSISQIVDLVKENTQQQTQKHPHIWIRAATYQSQTSGSSAARSWILSAPTEAGPPSWITLQHNRDDDYWSFLKFPKPEFSQRLQLADSSFVDPTTSLISRRQKDILLVVLREYSVTN